MKTLRPFLFGIAFAAAVVFVAGPQTRAFLAGALTAAATLIPALASRERLRQAARILNQIADIGERGRAQGKTPAAAKVEAPAPEPAAVELREEIASALINMGARKPAAIRAATAAAQKFTTFEPAFRFALKETQC